MWPDFENEFRGSTLMAGKKSTEKLGGGVKYSYYLLIFGGLQRACVFTFRFYEPQLNVDSLLVIGKLTWCPSPKEFVPTSQTFWT